MIWNWIHVNVFKHNWGVVESAVTSLWTLMSVSWLVRRVGWLVARSAYHSKNTGKLKFYPKIGPLVLSSAAMVSFRFCVCEMWFLFFGWNKDVFFYLGCCASFSAANLVFELNAEYINRFKTCSPHLKMSNSFSFCIANLP